MMKLGIGWFVLSVPAGLAIGWHFGGGIGLAAWMTQFAIWVAAMSALYSCLNCGAALGTSSKRRASSRTGFNCHTCGCVHRESDGFGAARLGSGRELVLPHAVAGCWLHPPLLERYAKLRRRKQAASALGAIAALLFVAWLLILRSDLNPLGLPDNAYPAVFGSCLALALFLYFGAGRCPHCNVSLSNQVGMEHTNTLVRWCDDCGAVLRLAPAAHQAYLEQCRVVDTPPEAGGRAEDAIAQADRLLKAGNAREACALIDRAMETYSDRRPLLDWLRRNSTALREL